MPENSSHLFSDAVARIRAGAKIELESARLVTALSADERLWLLDGDTPFWLGMGEMLLTGYNMRPLPMGSVERVGLPGLRFADGPRGIVVGQATAFPVPMARAATFDLDLEESIGAVIGEEGRARGANYFGGVCINLPRNPAWGRSQESFGEEPALLGEFGAALTRGTSRHLMVCVKHFALNSMENARFSVDVRIAESDLHEYFLPHFRRVVDEGVDSVMSAYNSVNGEWAGQNEYLLTTVLRDLWGFEGIVLSDFIWGHRDTGLSLRAGLDVEAPFLQQRARGLLQAIDDGTTGWEDVDRAARRIVGRQLALYARRPETDPDVAPPAADLAREAAIRSMVLVRNENVGGAPALPLARSTRLAIVGRLAGLPNTGDHGSSDVRAPYVVTAIEGLGTAFNEVRVDDTGDAASSACLAATTDAAIVVVGYTAAEEGEFVGGEIFSRPELDALYPEAVTSDDRAIEDELRASASSGRSVVGADTAGGDRDSVSLPPADIELIRSVAAVNARTIVVIVAGSTVVVEEWIDDVPAALFAWYSGMEGGNALAELLLGRRDFTGRLPFVVPSDASDLAPFDSDATQVTYDGSFGHRRLDRNGVTPRFPFGFGLSYGHVDVDVRGAERIGDAARVSVSVRNTGALATHHVVQLYARRSDGQQFLIGFDAVHAPAGAEVVAEITGDLRWIARWDSESRQMVVPSEVVEIRAARDWSDPDAISISV
ncbi:glycoside hydrolase family 3 C-terminal domain-containing protein [Microbacterium sp. HMH0099]|uniref:glycoside hydrolase family 3 protein n=1 Tax=Microbacterium sp. HMH0099 TaxID=3414026 RepID=UPI003BF64836